MAINATGVDAVFETLLILPSFVSCSAKTTVSGTYSAATTGIAPAGDKEAKSWVSNSVHTAPGDHDFQIVRSIIGEQKVKLEMLNSRYDSKSSASKICTLDEPVPSGIVLIRDETSEQVDRITEQVEQLHSMGTPVRNTLTIGMLEAPIELNQLFSITISIKTFSGDALKWDDVAARLIEKANSLRPEIGSHDHTSAAFSTCRICGKMKH